MTLYLVQCVKEGEDSMANPGAKSNDWVNLVTRYCGT